MKKEVWVDVKGYEGFYQVSSLGNVRSVDRIQICKNGLKRKLKSKNLKQFEKNGYRTVQIKKNKKYKNYLVHRLVAQSFINNHDNKICVNHINGVKNDNRIENLEWVTHAENTKHAWKNNLQNTSCENNGRSKLKEKDVLKIKELYKLGMKQQQIADKYNVSRSNISSIVRKKSWSSVFTNEIELREVE